MAVEPSLMASSEYSTWKRRPSGEKVLRRQSQSGIHVRGGRMCVLYATIWRKFQLLSDLLGAWRGGIPYSDRAMNILEI